jgi:putative two-component system response regulator
LSGEAIPLCARIVAVCDVYDALVNDRVYRPPMPEDQALAIMRQGRGSHFDPGLLDLFLDRLPQFRAIRARIAG